MSDRRTDIKENLAAERQALLGFIENLSDDDWTRPTINDPWTVRDVLAHLVGSEVSQHGLIQMWLDGNTTMNPEFDIDRWNVGQLRRRQGRSVPQLLDDLAVTRQETLKLLDGLSEEELDIIGEHPFSGAGTSIEQVIRGLYHHERLHLGDIRLALESLIGLLLKLPNIIGNLIESPLGILGDVWKRRTLIPGGGVVFWWVVFGRFSGCGQG